MTYGLDRTLRTRPFGTHFLTVHPAPWFVSPLRFPALAVDGPSDPFIGGKVCMKLMRIVNFLPTAGLLSDNMSLHAVTLAGNSHL